MTYDEELISEEELRRALEPERPEPDAFERAVREKIAQREGPEHDLGRSPSSFVQQAAALVPPVLLGGSSAGVKTLAPGVTSKGLLGILTLPVLSVFMLVLSFASGLQPLVKRRRGRDEEPAEEDEVVRAWWVANKKQAWISLFLLALLLLVQPAEAFVGLLLLSMLATVRVVRHLAAHGLATRGSVAGRLGQVLLGVAFGTIMFGYVVGNSAAFDPVVFAGILSGGAALAFLVQRREVGPTPGPIGPLIFTGLFLAAVPAQAFWGPADEERLVRHVEGWDEGPAQITDWQSWGYIARWLVDKGIDLDLARSEAALQKAFDRGDQVNAYSVLPLAYLDRLRPADWERYVQTESHYFGSEGILPFVEQFHLAIMALVKTRSLTEAERDLLAGRYLATIPVEPKFDGVKDCRVVLQGLRLLGREERFVEKRDEIHAQLEACWTGGPGKVVAGFNRQVERRSWRIADFFLMRTSADAIEVMEVAGVPSGVDLFALRRLLRRGARPLTRVLPLYQGYDLVGAAALDRLEARLSPGVEPWFDRLLAERLHLGAALLAILCLLLVMRLPSAHSSEIRG